MSDVELEQSVQYITVQEEEATLILPKSEPSSANLPDVFALIETNDTYYFLASYRGTSLQDLVTYNPGVLSSNLKISFIVYQLLRVIASLHSRGILHGNLKASNILVDENLWIQLAGIEFEPNPIDFEIPDEPLVVKWVKGNITNFSYLMALNHLAGRKEGDPNFYPILPWVTDFSGQTVEDGWRNFKKTKFRINKGDEQLDFTFDGPIPHHITDILSDITYYVYKARRTPIPVLCQFVRSKYEPNEYPSSMQRLYQWTPDECIPDFYTDPSIFRSIHTNMPDIQMPAWASSPEEFIRKHSEALESDYVSANLHHWIDLTFGHNLTGKGAIEAKNVALPLLAGQNSFMKHGIIQLFKDKHPQQKKRKKATLSTSPLTMNSEKLHDEPSYTAASSSMPVTAIESSITTGTDAISHIHNNKLHKSNSLKTRHTSLSNNSNHADANSTVTTTAGLVSHIPHTYTTGAISTGTNANRDRTPSIHSTASSIDTSRSLPSSLTVTTAITVTEPLVSVLRTEPIRMPISMEDQHFINDLEHYENMMIFATKYKFMESVANASEIWINPYYPTSLQRFEIDPITITDEKKPLDMKTNFFAVGAAYDMYCLGKIMDLVYMAGSSKVVDLDIESSRAPASGYFQIAPTSKVDVSPAVKKVIATLTTERWQDRPSAKAVLWPISNDILARYKCLPFSTTVPEIYEYLTAFHQAEWSRKLYLADKWIDRICDLEDERIISIFESLRPNIPKVLFSHKIVYEFVKRLGISVFLQQLLPCYLEALTTQEVNSGSATSNQVNSSGENTLPPIPTIAGDTMVYICVVLGPVLTSKHIIRQLVKITLRDNQIRPTMIYTTVRIMGAFGETFTAVQHAYLISLIDTSYSKLNDKLTLKNAKSIHALLTLLYELIPFMSNDALVTEFKSGFVSTLYQLLEPITQQHQENSGGMTVDNAKYFPPVVLSTEQLKLRLSISMKTIEYLLKVTEKLTVQEWETTILSILQKYFSGFSSTNLMEANQPLSSLLIKQKSYQVRNI
ncbi:MAG: hypothetical protein EXX96DRAFT_595686 [Benjaminiella poitrasii]|nr:MAG: hypothetical protein EXX96DRAFT_595686 [Benjaminiella poitrasii]